MQVSNFQMLMVGTCGSLHAPQRPALGAAPVARRAALRCTLLHSQGPSA
ncbi:hypothetical protein PQQ52_24800 [Paraburkholderia sediminicola]